MWREARWRGAAEFEVQRRRDVTRMEILAKPLAGKASMHQCINAALEPQPVHSVIFEDFGALRGNTSMALKLSNIKGRGQLVQSQMLHGDVGIR